jgi:hypothetical protein
MEFIFSTGRESVENISNSTGDVWQEYFLRRRFLMSSQDSGFHITIGAGPDTVPDAGHHGAHTNYRC